jgi:hypothetical protein
MNAFLTWHSEGFHYLIFFNLLIYSPHFFNYIYITYRKNVTLIGSSRKPPKFDGSMP